MSENSEFSISPLTGVRYRIPLDPEDKRGIDDFISLHSGRKVVIVQGLGFVGAVMSLVIANALTEEYAVIGVDRPSPASWWKIQAINEGLFPIVADDPKIELFYKEARRKKNLYATYDPYAYSKADVIVVDINLDVQKKSQNGELSAHDVDMRPFENAIRSIGENCRVNALVLVETTVPPGTCAKIVKPVLEEILTQRGLPVDQIMVGHSYERVMPGPKYIDSIQNFYRVYSGIDEKSARATENFLRTIIMDEYPLTRLASTNATEMAKVLENSYRAMNIAFIVEWSRFAEEAGVDLYEVVNAIRMRPTHKNIMLPGLGVGGYCLTKDPLMASWAKINLFNSPDGLSQSEMGVKINDRMPYYAFDFLASEFNLSLSGKKVLLLGVSYLNDVGDTRYTPVQAFYEQLKKADANITLHDPHIRYWEEKDQTVNNDLVQVLENDYDIIAITTGHKEYRNSDLLIENLLGRSVMFIYDTIGVLSGHEIAKLTRKHKVRVIGRGDLK